MATKVQIANIALVNYLGMSRINSLSEPGTGATLISGVYEDARREILSEWCWSFASRRVKLAKLVDNDRPEWAFRYSRPANCVRINWVSQPELIKASMNTGSLDDAARAVASESIYTDTPDAVIDFVYDQDDPETYPPKFVMAFAALLAGRAAIPGTETSAKVQHALGDYDRLKDEAMVFDVQQSPPIRVIRMVDWTGAR